MKNSFITSCAAALAAAAFLVAPLSHARAQEMDHAAVEELITAGPWKITYQQPYVGNWTIVRFFDRDGTFSTPGRPDISGRWKVYNKMVVQTFADGRKDEFSFPIAAAGVTGLAKTGIKLSAVRDNAAARPAAPVGGALEDPREREAAETLLTSGPWKISAGKTSTIHIFNKDGSFTTPGSTYENGRWKIGGGMITLTYGTPSAYYSTASSGTKDYIFLPLNEKGSTGALDSSQPTTVTLVNTPSTAAAAAPPGTNPLSTPPPRPVPGSASMRQEDRIAAEELLVSGPWKFSGNGWTAVRIFDKEGTFTTMGQPGVKGHGHWKIANNMVYLVYADTHTDTLLLPLNEKGTTGTDQYGEATTASMVNGTAIASNTRTPKPATVRPAATPAMAEATPAVVATEPTPASAEGGDPTIAVLTTGQWKFSTDNWSAIRIFKKDGTFTTKGKSGENGTWTVTDDKALIILAFPNGHKDAINLPLDPKGSSGIADSSDTMTAVQVLAPAPVAARTAKPGNSPAVLNPYGVAHP